MNDQGGLRKRRRLPDPKLPRETTDDTSISFRALGALLWIMSRPNGWTIRSDQMAKDGKRPNGLNAAGRKHRREGREAIRTALLDELAAEGYYRLERRRMLDGSVKMGTAASEEPVESWANQYEIFGRSPVPMVQQPDGSFLVQYPDGSTGPDDCDPPESYYQAQVVDDEGPDDIDESAGQTGDGFPGAGASPSDSPAPRNPAPGNPASGFPAPDNPSPLVEEEVKGYREEKPSSPPVLDLTQGGGSPSDGGEDAPQEEKTPNLAEIARWFVRRRAEWSTTDVEAGLTIAMNERGVPLATAAQALRELLAGEDRYGRTDTPYRLRLDQAWWKAVQPKTAAAQARLAAEPRCQERGHERNPANRCLMCMTDRYGPDEMVPDPAADAKAAAYTKAVRERQRAGLPPVSKQGGRKDDDVLVAAAS